MELKLCTVIVLLSGLAFVSSKLPVQDNSIETRAVLPSDAFENGGLTDWMFERLIRKALEAFRRLMKKGDAKRNIPVLDPMYSAKDTATYGDSEGMFNFKMDSYNVTTSGLSDFDINSVSASMFNLKADIDLTFNSINRKGTYDVKASLFNDVHVLYGQGKLDEGIQNLNTIIRLEFGLSLKKLYVKNVGVDFNLQQGRLNLDGLLNNSRLGQTVNEILTDGAANFVNKNRAKIQPHVEAAAKKRVSRLIDGMTLTELIAYLQALINA